MWISTYVARQCVYVISNQEGQLGSKDDFVIPPDFQIGLVIGLDIVPIAF